MLRGYYTSISSMLELQSRQNVTANNIANINTTGYKTESVVSKPFDEVMLANKDKYVNGQAKTQILGGLSTGVRIDETITNYGQGSVVSDDSNTSFALIGDGMFTVRKPDGTTAYTRNGVFKIDRGGYLVTTEGYNVMGIRSGTGALEPIKFESDEISMDYDNNILENGNQKYRFNIVNITDTKAIKKGVDNTYTVIASKGNVVQPLGKYTIQQKAKEASNVDLVTETTNLMTIMRAFEANQSVVKAVDSTLAQVASEIGRI